MGIDSFLYMYGGMELNSSDTREMTLHILNDFCDDACGIFTYAYPVVVSRRKLSKCRSPMPSTYEQAFRVASDLANPPLTR